MMAPLIIRQGPLIEQAIGEWNDKKGLTIYETNMWKRRKNLHGSVIRWTAIKYPVLSPQFDYNEDGKVQGIKVLSTFSLLPALTA